MTEKRFDPITPGEILNTEYLTPLGIPPGRLAAAISIPPSHVAEILDGMRRITADTALRLARYFSTTERYWLNLQTRFDIESVRERIADELAAITPL